MIHIKWNIVPVCNFIQYIKDTVTFLSVDTLVDFIKYATILCSFTATQMDMEIIILNEANQKNTNII